MIVTIITIEMLEWESERPSMTATELVAGAAAAARTTAATRFNAAPSQRRDRRCCSVERGGEESRVR